MKIKTLALINALHEGQKMAANPLMDSHLVIHAPISRFGKGYAGGWHVAIAQEGKAVIEHHDKLLSRALMGAAKKLLAAGVAKRMTHRPEYAALNRLIVVDQSEVKS